MKLKMIVERTEKGIVSSRFAVTRTKLGSYDVHGELSLIVLLSLSLVWVCLQSFASKDKTIRLLSTANVMMLNRLNYIQSI